MTQRRHASSSQRLAVVLSQHETLATKLRERLQARRQSGYLDVSDEEFENLLRVVRVLTHEALIDVYRQGRCDGRAHARIELGYNVDSDANDAKTVVCPTCLRSIA